MSDTMSAAAGEVQLVLTTRERLASKDFEAEVRAGMDMQQFVHSAHLLVDCELSQPADIIDAMLAKILADEPTRPPKSPDSLGKQVSVSGSGRTLLARTIQARDDKAGFDQSWLVVLCESTTVHARRSALARLTAPVAVSEHAGQVRLIALIAAPLNDKPTKSALELGRTLATVLADRVTSQALIEARTDVEMRALLLARARRLAHRDSFVNRHRYLLGASVVHLAGSYLDREKALDVGGRCHQNKLPVCTGSALARKLELSQAASSPRAGKLIELMSLPSSQSERSDSGPQVTIVDSKEGSNKSALCSQLEFGTSLWTDFKRRLPFYPSDFRDAFVGPPGTVHKTLATTWFLYFGILLPTIAFSALNTTQTHGHMGDLRKAVFGQALGGLGFALLGGQPLVIIMTTAPLCLYTKIIHQMCLDYGFEFPAMYAAVGLWNGVFLTLYSLFGFSKLMRWCTRSTEEIFALFIVIAFIIDASKDMLKNFDLYYFTDACGRPQSGSALLDLTSTSDCHREASVLFVLLMVGTVCLALSLLKFKHTPYLTGPLRALLSDYALPLAVVSMSFMGSFVFGDVHAERSAPLAELEFTRAPVERLPASGLLLSLCLGFMLSLLFFMDQNISAAMVDAPQNKLKKGTAYHYDLLVVASLNALLAMYGMPMMHGVLPHSPLHARSLADVETRIIEGHQVQVVVNARETRVTALVAHLLILASLYLIPYPIGYIPTAVLNGLFLYMAVTSLDGLEVFERIKLLFTEQTKYPPTHYIRRCSQRHMHRFTFLQLGQLLVFCLFGFSPFNTVEMFFPIIILLMIPFRHRVVPKLIEPAYLDALDGFRNH